MSMLQRLKSKKAPAGKKSTSRNPEPSAAKVAQLHVDVYRTEHKIVVYAQSAGADISDVTVSVEGDANIVLLEGYRARPEYVAFAKGTPPGVFLTEECAWGDFYRRIILPASVDIQNAEAKLKNGVLVLSLPLLKTNEKANPRPPVRPASHIRHT